MYYFLSVTPNYPNSYWLEYYRTSSIDSVVFLGNTRISEPITPLIFNINKPISIERFKKYDYLMTDIAPIISERFANMLNELAPHDIQLIRARVFNRSESVGNYYLPIYLKLIDCIDWSTSIYCKELDMFKKIDLLPHSLKNNNIVKAKGYELGLPIVQEEVYSKCKKMIGCSFIKNPYINPLLEI